MAKFNYWPLVVMALPAALDWRVMLIVAVVAVVAMWEMRWYMRAFLDAPHQAQLNVISLLPWTNHTREEHKSKTGQPKKKKPRQAKQKRSPKTPHVSSGAPAPVRLRPGPRRRAPGHHSQSPGSLPGRGARADPRPAPHRADSDPR